MIGSIILALIVGAIIGLVARLVMPGKQDIGMVATVLVGALGGLIGSAVASHFGYHNANGGVAWIPFFIGVAAAVVLIAIYESLIGRRGGRHHGSAWRHHGSAYSYQVALVARSSESPPLSR